MQCPFLYIDIIFIIVVVGVSNLRELEKTLLDTDFIYLCIHGLLILKNDLKNYAHSLKFQNRSDPKTQRRLIS